MNFAQNDDEMLFWFCLPITLLFFILIKNWFGACLRSSSVVLFCWCILLVRREYQTSFGVIENMYIFIFWQISKTFNVLPNLWNLDLCSRSLLYRSSIHMIEYISRNNKYPSDDHCGVNLFVQNWVDTYGPSPLMRLDSNNYTVWVISYQPCCSRSGILIRF